VETEAPRVTVVIPAYKASGTVARAVESVLAQPGQKAGVVVVLDGPDQAAEQALAAYPKARVQVIHHETNQGVCAARNLGLANVAEPYVMFLDADDYIEGEFLSSGAVQMAEAGADLGLAEMEVLNEATNRRSRVSVAGLSALELYRSWLRSERFVAPSSVLWRTEFMKGIGGWDEALLRQEDGEIVLRALLMGATHCDLRSGHGVYVQHSRPERLTVRKDNLRSLLDVPAKLLALDSDAIPLETRRSAAAVSYANAARTMFLRNCPELANEALVRMKALGTSRPRARGLFNVIYALLPLKAAVVVERAIRVMLRRPY
jgi:glycosyltransferase involved in cell wall biosynthesis